MKTLKLKDWEDLPENYTGIIEWNTGIISYYLNGFYHREDGPAVIWPDGTMFYYINNKIHREDGPAVIWDNGTVSYYLNDDNITKEINEWIIGKTDIPPYEKWDNNTRLIFKLTFG